MEDVQVSVEESQGLARRVRVNVPAQRIDAEVEARLRSFGRNARIRGFRPGKVPPNVLRQRFGEQVRREVLQDVMQASYSEAVTREKLRPAGDPRIDTDIDSVPKGADLTYTASFEVFPEFELQGLDRLAIDRPQPGIDEADIGFVIDRLRRQRAHWEAVQRPARDADQVAVDFAGSLNGEAIEGGSGENVTVHLGAGTMLPDFERQLVGMGPGEVRQAKVQFPADYPAPALAGQQADFTITLREVREEQLPEVDEAFIQTYGIESGLLEDFQASIRKNLEAEFASRAWADVKRQVLDRILEANPISVPAVLVDNETATLHADAVRRLGARNPEQAPALESFRSAAERRVRLGLLIGAVIRENQVTPDRERVRQRIDQLSAGYEKPEELRRVYYQNPELMQQVENAVLEDQVIDLLAERAAANPLPMPFRDLVNR